MSTLNTFRIVQEQVVKSAVNYHSGPYKDLMKLIEFILKKFFKAATENPMLYVEALFPIRSHTRSKGTIEQEDDRKTGLSDDDDNNNVSELVLKLFSDRLQQKFDPEFPDAAQTSANKRKKRSRRRSENGEQVERTARQEQMQSYLSAKFIEDSDEGRLTRQSSK